MWIFSYQCSIYYCNLRIFYFKIKPFEAHNALNDTLNTVKVLEKLDFAKGIEEQREYYYADAV